MSLARTIVRRVVPRAVRNWVRAPGVTLRRLADELRYTAGHRPRVALGPDWNVICHPAAVRGGYRAYRDDPAQAAELAAFVRSASPSMVLFDLGAHFGAFSLAALHFGGAGARAVAVEPSPTAVRMLKRQAALNGVAPRLEVVQAAVGDHAGTMPMIPVGVIAAGYYVASDGEHEARETRLVPVVTVDALASQLGLTPTHLKIDVEGAEAAALRGARQVLRGSHPPLVFLELHVGLIRARGGDAMEPLRLLADARYRAEDWDGRPLRDAELLTQPLMRFQARPSAAA